MHLVRVVLSALALTSLIAATTPGSAAAQQAQGVQRVGTYNAASGGAVAASGTTVYLATRGELLVLDVANPARPTVAGRTTQVTATHLAVQNNLVFAAAGSAVQVTDVSDPRSPRVTATETTTATDVVAVGNRLYVAAGLEGMRIYLIGPMGTLTLLGRWDPGPLSRDMPRNATGVAVSGNYAVLATLLGGLIVVDVSNPAQPREVGSATGRTLSDVSVDAGYAYAASTDRSVRVFYLGDPTRPTEVGAYLTPGLFEPPGPIARLEAVGSKVYLAESGDAIRTGGLRVVDAADPTKPTSIAYYPSAQGNDLAVAGDLVHLLDAERGLLVLRYPGAPPTGLQPRAYVPLLPQQSTLPATSGSFVASLTLQNPSSSTAAVELQLRRADGSAANQPQQFQLAAGRSQLVYLPAMTDLPAGSYAAVVSSDQAIQAVANLLAPGPARAGGYLGAPTADAATTVWIPNAFRAYFGYTSFVAVQNTSGTAVSVTLTYRDTNGTVVGSAEGGTIPANGFATFDQGAAAGLPDGFVGSATIVADQPVVAAGLVVKPSGELSAATGIVAGSSLTNLPIVYKNYSADGWISSILVQNLEPYPAEVGITFGSTDPFPLLRDTIPANSSRQYYLPDISVVPDGFAGPARISAPLGRLAAVVNTRNAAGQLSSAAGFRPSQAAGSLGLPTLYNGYSALNWTSSLIVYSASPGISGSTPITITYFDANGPVKTVQDTLARSEAKLYYLPNQGLPAGFVGSAQVTADGGGLVSALVNNLAAGQSGGDWLLTTEAGTITP